MSEFMKGTARYYLVIKAVRMIVKEIEKAGLDNLKLLADKGVSIVGTYLEGCSPKEQAEYRRDLRALLRMGATYDMILSEVARQMPVIAPIIESKPEYRRSEVQRLEAFAKEG